VQARGRERAYGQSRKSDVRKATEGNRAQERAREKAAKRVERKETWVKPDRKATPEDPDIAGIVPGPQPLPYDLLDEEIEAEKKPQS
jgi:hypothetical protein